MVQGMIRLNLKRYKARRKVFVATFSMFLIGLLLWGRLLLKDLPRTAIAAPDDVYEVSDCCSGELEQSKKCAVVGVDGLNIASNRHKHNLSDEVEAKGKKLIGIGRDNMGRITKVYKQASTLKLQRVWGGKQPGAVINGIVVMPGEEILGFLLQEVSSNSVVVQKDGILMELMQ